MRGWPPSRSLFLQPRSLSLVTPAAHCRHPRGNEDGRRPTRGSSFFFPEVTATLDPRLRGGDGNEEVAGVNKAAQPCGPARPPPGVPEPRRNVMGAGVSTSPHCPSSPPRLDGPVSRWAGGFQIGRGPGPVPASGREGRGLKPFLLSRQVPSGRERPGGSCRSGPALAGLPFPVRQFAGFESRSLLIRVPPARPLRAWRFRAAARPGVPGSAAKPKRRRFSRFRSGFDRKANLSVYALPGSTVRTIGANPLRRSRPVRGRKPKLAGPSPFGALLR